MPRLSNEALAALDAGRDLEAELKKDLAALRAGRVGRVSVVTDDGQVIDSPMARARVMSGLSQTRFAALLGVSVRTLQRMAHRYVGLSPAAMIRRRRLQEAAERIRSDPGADLATVAAELGYADQAHLANDFRAVLGFTPSAYRADAGPSRA